MDTKYQLVIIGTNNAYKDKIIDTFNKRVQDLGLTRNSVIILDEKNFKGNYSKNSPTVALYFGGNVSKFPNIDILETLINDASFILPIGDDLDRILAQIPEDINSLNAYRLDNESKVEPLVSRILEGFSLLRTERRLFISYRRVESRSIAVQLYESLDQAGFDVFLDTHSIRPGDPVQEELWHRLVDTDVVVLLDTIGFLVSEWTERELAKASAMSIGILQLIWPNSNSIKNSPLSIPVNLKKEDFEREDFTNRNSLLLDSTIQYITSQVESLRARNLAARRDNLIAEFMKSAESLNMSPTLHSEKIITIDRSDGKSVGVIPTVGVPHAFTYHQKDDLVKAIKLNNVIESFLIYDHSNIKDEWLSHLSWLDKRLPIKTIKFTDREEWLKQL
jgi:hypothetical protein